LKELIIKNGFVYDPLNKINGEIMDICIRDDKIVESVSDKAEVIDATGMVVMPGGVDLHSHIAGGEVDTARMLRPEDHYKDVECKTAITHSGVGHSLPTTYITGYRYSKMGYTTVMTPSAVALQARHVHEELKDTPMLDSGIFTLLGDWWFSLEHIRDGLLEKNAAHLAWMLNSSKAYAIKVVNPGGLESWGFGRNVRGIDDEVPNFGITPREIVRGLIRANTLLNLPHSIHLHCNKLGQPGNSSVTLDTMKAVENLAKDDKPIMHITHVQFNAYGGEDWSTFKSGAEELAKYMNNHNHVTMDMGQVTFTDTTTMTADGPAQFGLYNVTGNKWVNHDVGTECAGGIVPIRYKRTSPVNALQWSIGLEMALLVKDPWKIFMTTDHPNGGPFTLYPKVISWLMSKAARDKVFKKLHKQAKRKSLLPTIDRELTLYELAVMTRAGTAKVLGMKQKGHLGVGADADVAVYNINPEKVDIAKKYLTLRKALKRAAYTIKAGEVVVKDGEVVKEVFGNVHHLNIETKRPADAYGDLQERFKDYVTLEYENYPIQDGFVHNPISVPVKAGV